MVAKKQSKLLSLIHIGDLDHSFNREIAEIQTGIKNSTRIVMQDCGHLPFIEEPETFGSNVAEFLRMKTERSKLQHDMLYTEASLNGFYDFL